MAFKLLILSLLFSSSHLQDLNNNQTIFIDFCSDFFEVENGKVNIPKTLPLTAYIECNPGFELIGQPKILCIDSHWEHNILPKCVPKCHPPPLINNGALELDSNKDENGMYRKGTVATYSCGEGYRLTPPESIYRVCEKGIWTGSMAACVPSEKMINCKPPKGILNGYFVHDKHNVVQRLHYNCNTGYYLIGSSVQTCLKDGTWSPKLPPVCLENMGKFVYSYQTIF